MNRHPFGSWPSPLSAADIAGGAKRLVGLAWREGQLWWAETRPAEAGRVALVRSIGGGEPGDVVGGAWSARSLVHEYGGGAWWLGNEAAYFVNAEDQRIYALDGVFQNENKAPLAPLLPRPLTPKSASQPSARFADGAEHRSGTCLAAVRETHGLGDEEPRNEVVLIPLAAPISGMVSEVEAAIQEPVVVASGADFYAAPRFSPDGKHLSWIQWNHPQMPWDGTELFVAALSFEPGNKGHATVGEPVKVAGDVSTSIVGAAWTSRGQLTFSTDKSGFWNLEQYDPASASTSQMTALHGVEIGAPPWVFGSQQWAELSSGDLAVVATASAADSLAILSTSAVEVVRSIALHTIDSEYCQIDALAAGPGGSLFLTGSSAESMAEVVELTRPIDKTLRDGASSKVIYQPAGRLLPGAWVSKAEHLEFPSGDGTAHAFFYPPTGALAADPLGGLAGELPPLIVMGHGGPTSHSAPCLGFKVQFWTSRGFAVADVNYRGSTGFGRDYRRLLRGRWGIVDVEDCVAVARFAAQQGLVDPNRIAIRGGSAGGFTVLRALQISEVFSAGTSLYGVADLEALARDTHKFESRYLDGLIGPYPQRQDIYVERSPINHTDSLKCPLLLLQGSEDRVVPPSQSEAIVAAVKEKDLPHAYVLFEGEQHGFRQAESIVRAFEVELWFYSQIFGFEAADNLLKPPEASGF